jgi:uncharacterized repeat protein (TIGR01451 family)
VSKVRGRCRRKGLASHVVSAGLAAMLLMNSTALAAVASFITPATAGSYTVPAGVTRVQITARGADGGQATALATFGSGAGASISSVFNVVPGDVIRYVIGQRGSNGDFESGGGGGTGVFINSTLIMVAGGGGGEDNTGNGGGGQAGTGGGNGTTGTTNGVAGIGGAGGTGGNTGGTVAPVGDGGGGGGGINSAGGNVASSGGSSTTGGGIADTNVADGLTVSAGGTSNQTTDPAGADGLGASGGAGFGGGGAASHRESGGGGGYSGGGGGGSGGSPGGGGSYLNTAFSGYVSGTITAGAASSAGGIDGNVTVSYTTVQLRKITTGNVGTFSFSSPNLSTTPVPLTTTVPNTAVSSGAIPLTTFGLSTTITEAAVSGYTVTSIGCSGLGGGTATPNLPARTVTLDTAATTAGNDVICTYTNNWPGPALTIQKTANTAGPVTVGQVITYTYVITNPSPVTINNITVADAHNGLGMPPVPGSEFLLNDAAPTGNSTDVTANNGTWTTLATGDTIRFTSTYTVTQSDIDFRQ